LIFALAAAAVCLSGPAARSAEERDPELSDNVTVIETPAEKEHKPEIKVPKTVKKGELFMVSVQVGETPFRASEDHHIEWLEGYLEGKKIFRLSIFPGMPEPRIIFPLRIRRDSLLRVTAHCSKHGTWGEEVEIRVR
jgi:desulfoferrodoxin (superoxide reductase-like protein)